MEIHGLTAYCGRPVWNFCGNYKEILVENPVPQCGI